jgi:sugar phosphate isomerase/epimerase
MRYLMFSKPLQTLPAPELGRVVKALGFDGVELTVRPGGHVRPEQVEAELPRAVETLAALGLAVPAIVVEIHGHESPHADRICRAAGRVGATVLRTSSRRYTRFGVIREEIATARAGARELEELGQAHGVRLCIHCHSGAYLSADGATLAAIVEGTDPRHVGVSLDVGHLTVEGSAGGWRQSLDLLQGRVGILAVKSFGWLVEPDPTTGGRRWTPKVMPLAEGGVQWREAVALLRQTGWDADGRALVSLHSEYQGEESWRDLSVEQVIDQTGDDLAWFRRQVDAAVPA